MPIKIIRKLVVTVSRTHNRDDETWVKETAEMFPPMVEVSRLWNIEDIELIEENLKGV